MRLLFLGTGGYHPNERRHTASLLFPDIGLALDAGTGFFRVQERLQTDTLDVFLTHAHLDHICGLTFFLVPVLRGDVTGVRVHGTARTLTAVRQHLFAEELCPSRRFPGNYKFRSKLFGHCDNPAKRRFIRGSL